MTVSRLRTELTDSEFVYFAAFYELKNEQEKKEMDKVQNRSVIPKSR